MAIGNLKIESYVPVVKQNEGIYSEYNIETTGTFIGQVDITGGGVDLDEASTLTLSSSTVGNVEPLVVATTLSGVGATGGRVKATLDTNVALGGWSNALKGQVTYGASGKTTGLGSGIVSEMTLSAGTSDGTYTLYEGELNLGAGASTGTLTSLYHASVNGAAAGTFDDNGYVLSLQGLTAGAAHVFRTGLTGATVVGNMTAALRIKVGATDYYIPIATATA